MGDVSGGCKGGCEWRDAFKVTAAWDYICSMGCYVTTVI